LLPLKKSTPSLERKVANGRSSVIPAVTKVPSHLTNGIMNNFWFLERKKGERQRTQTK
jgi:hypothetical protein